MRRDIRIIRRLPLYNGGRELARKSSRENKRNTRKIGGWKIENTRQNEFFCDINWRAKRGQERIQPKRYKKNTDEPRKLQNSLH